MLLALLAFLSACAESTQRDPASDAGMPFDFGESCEGRTLPWFDAGLDVHPFECRESTRIRLTGLRFAFAEDGAAFIGVPDGLEVHGAIGCEDGEWIFRERDDSATYVPWAFALRRAADPRAAFVMESVDPSTPWRAWAVRVPAPPPAGVEVPELGVACATFERWELSTKSDGRVLGEGERVPAEPHLPQLSLRSFGSSDSVWFWDSSLMRSFGGTATAWNGAAGTARAPIESTACSVFGDAITFSRTGDTWTVEVPWRVPDTDDLDGDGDRENEILRHSRYVASADGCR